VSGSIYCGYTIPLHVSILIDHHQVDNLSRSKHVVVQYKHNQVILTFSSGLCPFLINYYIMTSRTTAL
jgi:hypothetical protein